MDEVAYYDLHATAVGAGNAANRNAKRYAEDLMILHLHLEHKMGVREIAKRFNRKMVEIKNVIHPRDEA
jgi:hypothetical protein